MSLGLSGRGFRQMTDIRRPPARVRIPLGWNGLQTQYR